MRITLVLLCLGFLVAFPLMSLVLAAGDVEAGKKVHQEFCVRCHGEGGKGDGVASKLLKDKPADWTDSALMSGYTDDQLLEVIKKGGGAVGKSKLMPAFETKLEDQQINDVIAFIRSLQ